MLFSLNGPIRVALLATLDVVIALIAWVWGAEIPDAVLTGAVLFVLATGTAIVGWALVLLVKLSNAVASLQSDALDHERRLERLEP